MINKYNTFLNYLHIFKMKLKEVEEEDCVHTYTYMYIHVCIAVDEFIIIFHKSSTKCSIY